MGSKNFTFQPTPLPQILQVDKQELIILTLDHHSIFNFTEMQREMLSQQKFTMQGAINRAGASLMKGKSPISSQDQAISMLTRWIDQQVSDPSGALKSVLCRQVRNNELLLGRHQKNLLSALQEIVDKILACNFALHEFVRQIDVRWGELNQERPLFQRAGQSPDPADEYT